MTDKEESAPIAAPAVPAAEVDPAKAETTSAASVEETKTAASVDDKKPEAAAKPAEPEPVKEESVKPAEGEHTSFFNHLPPCTFPTNSYTSI